MTASPVQNIGMIFPTSLSFESILNDLKVYALNKPAGLVWQDWLLSSDGEIVAEWIAGLACFRAYHEFMRIREGQLDNAQLNSSVWNLAFNKGLLIPPALAGELSLNMTTPSSMSFSKGDLVAVLGNYEVYSLESKTIDGTDDLHCVVGHFQQFVRSVPGLQKFQTFKFNAADDFFALQLEEFLIDGHPITLLSDSDFLHGNHTDFILRRTMPNQSRVYIGNGIIGWYQASGSQIQYNVLTYSEDVALAMAGDPSLVQSDITFNSSTIVTEPSFSPGIEDVRSVARYYPLDGRCVTDSDYKAIILKNFGGVLQDVFAFNTNPDEHIWLLKSPNFGAPNSTQETAYLAQITSLINSKRALGMQTFYTLRDSSAGLSFVTAMHIPEALYTNDLVVKANQYLFKRCFKFITKVTTFTTEDLAIDLSAQFGITFYPNAQTSITAQATDFFQVFSISATSF